MANLLYMFGSKECMFPQWRTAWPNILVAQNDRICDTSWRIDFGKLFQFAGNEKSEVKKAMLFGSRPLPNDSLWEAAKRKGFEPAVYNRNVANREKKIDTDIVATMMEYSFTLVDVENDEITLVAGDADYVPAIERLKDRGIDVHVVFWAHAAKKLKEVATQVVELAQYLEHLRR